MQFLTTDEVAALLRVHRSTVQRMIQAGKFPHARSVGIGVGRKTYRIPKEDFDNLFNDDAQARERETIAIEAAKARTVRSGGERGVELYRKFSKAK